jgi:hypothetical protein
VGEGGGGGGGGKEADERVGAKLRIEIDVAHEAVRHSTPTPTLLASGQNSGPAFVILIETGISRDQLIKK